MLGKKAFYNFEKRHLNYVNKYMVHISEATADMVDKLYFEEMFLDTESCDKPKNEININNQFYNDVDFEEVHTYCVQLGSIYCDYVFWCNGINDMIEWLKGIIKDRLADDPLFKEKFNWGNTQFIDDNDMLKTLFKPYQINIGIHNLKWEAEFFKYVYTNNNYKYKYKEIPLKSKDKNNNKVDFTPAKPRYLKNRENIRTFNITHDGGAVYSMNLLTEPLFVIEKEIMRCTKAKHLVGQFKQIEVPILINFWDTAKVIVDSLDNFKEYIPNLDPMFYKLKDAYDYESIRSSDHILNDLEKRYCYNDIRLMREAMEQYIIPELWGQESFEKGGMIYNSLATKDKDGKRKALPRTAAGIAIHKVIQIEFDSIMNNFKYHFGIKERSGASVTMDEFLTYYTMDDLKNSSLVRKVTSSKNSMVVFSGITKLQQIFEELAYAGGFTHAVHKNVHKKVKCNGSSCDKNSSYPTEMTYAELPKGKGTYISKWTKDYKLQNELALIAISFDYVSPRDEDNALEIFKIGMGNKESINKMLKKEHTISASEYFATNVDDFGNVYKIKREFSNINLAKLRMKGSYKMIVTNKELEFLEDNFEFGYYEEDELLDYNGLDYGMAYKYDSEVGRLKTFITTFTKQKIENKNINAAKYAAAKLFMNSSYGKFGSKTLKIEKNLVQNIQTGLYSWKKVDGSEYEGESWYVPYAAFITSGGRIALYNILKAVQAKGEALYLDTDSVYTTLPKKTLIKVIESTGAKVDKTELGAWDIETEFKEFKTIGQKKYIYNKLNTKNNEYEIKVKCSGVPKAGQKVLAAKGIDYFQLGIIVKKKQSCKVYGGAKIKDVEMKIHDSIFYR